MIVIVVVVIVTGGKQIQLPVFLDWTGSLTTNGNVFRWTYGRMDVLTNGNNVEMDMGSYGHVIMVMGNGCIS